MERQPRLFFYVGERTLSLFLVEMGDGGTADLADLVMSVFIDGMNYIYKEWMLGSLQLTEYGDGCQVPSSSHTHQVNAFVQPRRQIRFPPLVYAASSFHPRMLIIRYRPIAEQGDRSIFSARHIHFHPSGVILLAAQSPTKSWRLARSRCERDGIALSSSNTPSLEVSGSTSP